ncbi:MAG: hypothetical protein JOZ41_08290 [Chloroflexi bacterium]|nr:hypothetical protein [Chloroflexota bacterium]
MLILCAIPVLAGLFLFIGYEASGNGVPLPFVSAPSVNVPSVPAENRVLPAPANEALQSMRDNPLIASTLAIVGALALVTLLSMWGDFRHSRRKALAERALRGEDGGDDSMDAPWLQGQD